MRKLAVVGVALVLLLLVGVVALAFVEFDSPELGRAALDQAEAVSGARLGAERYRLNLLDGLVAEGVTAAGEVPGGRYDLKVERLVFEHRLLPLLGGTVAVDRVRVEGPELELVTTGSGAPAAGAETGAETGDTAPPSALAALEVGEVAITGGRIALRDETGAVPPVDVEGLDFRMADLKLDPEADSLFAGLGARGRLSVDRVALEATEVTEASGEFRIEGGRLETHDVSFRTAEGRFGVDFAVDLAGVPLRYSMALRGDPLDLNRASGSPGGLGPATFALDAEGRGTDASGVQGAGTVSLAAGTLPEHPVLLGLQQATGVSGIAGAAYEPSEARFRVAHERVELEPFALKSGDVSLELEGAVGLDAAQTLDLRLGLLAPRDRVRVDGVGDAVLDALTDDAGRVRVPVRVTGPSQSPRVLPDARAMVASARHSGVRALGDKATGGLKKLLGRN